MTCSVVVGLDVAAERHLAAHSPNWSHRMVEAKFRMVEGARQPADLVVLGDSSAAHGVRPEVWQAQTGERVVNLATVAGLGATGDAWLLQAYIDAVGAPKRVVVMHTVDLWDRSVSPALAGQVPNGVSGRRPLPDFGAEDWRDELISRYLPLYAESGSLVSSLFGHPVPEGLRFSMDDTGWVPSRTPDAAQLARDVEDFSKAVRRVDWRLSDDNHAALAVLAQTCQARNLPLTLVHAPVLDAVEGSANALKPGIEEAVRSAVAPMEVTFVEVPLHLTIEDVESTVDHLRPEAAARFTEQLAHAVRRMD